MVRIGVLRYLGGQDWSSEGSVMVRIGVLRYVGGVRTGVLRAQGWSGLGF